MDVKATLVMYEEDFEPALIAFRQFVKEKRPVKIVGMRVIQDNTTGKHQLHIDTQPCEPASPPKVILPTRPREEPNNF